jgi:hypothetical protein
MLDLRFISALVLTFKFFVFLDSLRGIFFGVSCTSATPRNKEFLVKIFLTTKSCCPIPIDQEDVFAE